MFKYWFNCWGFYHFYLSNNQNILFRWTLIWGIWKTRTVKVNIAFFSAWEHSDLNRMLDTFNCTDVRWEINAVTGPSFSWCVLACGDASLPVCVCIRVFYSCTRIYCRMGERACFITPRSLVKYRLSGHTHTHTRVEGRCVQLQIAGGLKCVLMFHKRAQHSCPAVF